MTEMLTVVAEATPNPNTLKFTCGRQVLETGGPFDYSSEAAAEKSSPLARVLFGLNGVVGVFIARDFVSVTKHPGVSWVHLQSAAAETIREHLAEGGLVVDLSTVAAVPVSDPQEVEAKIRQILDRDIRPAVAMDGGDIQLVGYNAGVVMLQMKGACNGCPSSTATLKMGVERRLRQEIPEIVEVLAMM